MNNTLAQDSIAAHLSRGLVLVVSGLLLAFAIGVEVLFVHHLRAEFDRALLAKAQSLSALLEQDEEGVDFDFAPESMPEFAAGPSADYFQLWLASWPHARRAPALGGDDLPRLPDRSQSPRYRNLTLPDGRAGRAVQLDFLANLDPKEHLDPARIERPLATLVTARDSSALERLVSGLRMALALLVVTGIALAHTLVRRTISHGLQPLGAVQAQLANLHVTTLNARLALPDKAAELAPLLEQFNVLLAELEDAFRREQTFSAAAAHELRTPLAEIRSLAEIGARFADDRALASEYFADIVAAVTQLETLTRNLLALARHDTIGSNQPQLEDIDLTAAIAVAWDAELASAHARKLRLCYSGPAAVNVYSQRNVLQLLLHNVIGNAVAHSPADAEIAIECRVESSGIALAVANPRGDLEEHDLPQIFERFWRKDAARRDDGHAGLGLSLVRAYAEQIGVEVTAKTDAQGRFILQFENFTAVPTRA